MKLSSRILRVLKQTGPRKPHAFRGLAESRGEFEQAIGQLFLKGSVEWRGKTVGRVLAAKTAA